MITGRLSPPAIAQMMIRKIIRVLNYYLFYLTTIPIVVATMVTTIDVIGRYFRRPLLGAMEITQLSLVLIIAFSLAHTQAQKGHIDIDMFYNLMPSRAKDISNVFTAFLALVIVGLMTWRAIPWLQFSIRIQEWSMLLHWPVWPFKLMVFIGLLCLSFQLIIDLVDQVLKLSEKAAVKVEVGPAESDRRLMD